MLLRIITHELKWELDYNQVSGQSVESKELRHTFIDPERVSSIVFSPGDALGFAQLCCGPKTFWVDIRMASMVASYINSDASPTRQAVEEILAEETMKANAKFKPDADAE